MSKTPGRARGAATVLWTCFAAIGLLALIASCTSPDRPYGPETTGAGTAGHGGEGGAADGGGSQATGGSGGGLAQGDGCNLGSECASGACVDGVCCEDACVGACNGCLQLITGKPNGTCAPVQAGTDPRDACPDDGPSSCGGTGTCDGLGACALYGASTECAPSSCAAGTKTLPKTCDGAGQCQGNGTTECVPHQCMGDVCSGDCTDDLACAGTEYCETSTGACLPKRAQGDSCDPTRPSACQTGFCADNVCCDSACDQPCASCSAAVTSAPDGTCVPVPVGTDPDGDCPTDSPSTCGGDGFCDGAGACRKYSAGVPCSVQTCTGSTQRNVDTCDGQGACVDSGTTDCSPFVCGFNGCKTSCGDDNDCIATSFCSSGQCSGKKANGGACANGSECTSTFCVDAVCCDQACSGACKACTAARKGQGADGVCGVTIAGVDPHSDCADGGAASCGFDGTCDGAGACRRYVAGTVCVAGTCAIGTAQLPRTCDGAGVCTLSGMQLCKPYACGATACKTTCGGDADCASGNFCKGTACLPKQPQGSPCSVSSECLNNTCVDHFCCENACTGLCNSCDGRYNVSGSNGKCGQIVCADPDNECSGTMVCSGGLCKSADLCTASAQ